MQQRPEEAHIDKAVPLRPFRRRCLGEKLDTGFVRNIHKFSLIPAVMLTLSACGDGAGPTEVEDLRGSVIETDVITEDMLAPEAFSITDTALWDGRPTFGGVWIAYPNIDTPERVRITNPENDKSVIGALYKRESGFPGPQIELSADAAASLGIIAGVPADLRVVAMRRVDVEVDPTIATGPQPMVTPLQRPSTRNTTPAVAGVAVLDAASIVAPAVEPVAAPETPAANEAAPVVEATTLPPVEPAAVAAPVAAAPVAPAPAAADPNSTFIQVATFQSERRAKDAVKKLETAGLSVEIRETKAGSQTHYRVIVGPATSPEAVEIMMSVVREIGFRDAIALR